LVMKCGNAAGRPTALGSVRRAELIVRNMATSFGRNLTRSGDHRCLAPLRQSKPITGSTKISMKDPFHPAREFFKGDEYARFLEELLHTPETYEDTIPSPHPHITMFYLHIDFGICRDEMAIGDGQVMLTADAARSLARQRLRHPDVDPDTQDRIMDMLCQIERHERHKRHEK